MADQSGLIRLGDDVNVNENVILNPRFDDGLNGWAGRGCRIVLHDSTTDKRIIPQTGRYFAAATDRTQTWNGIQQEITESAKRKLAYEVTAVIRLYGKNSSSGTVLATLYVQTPDQREQYISIASVQATDNDWLQLQGKFLINSSPSKVVIYFEGPPAGTDILLNYLIVKHAEKIAPSPPPDTQDIDFGVNVIENSDLGDGIDGWSPLGNCTLSIRTGSPRVLPPMARDSLGPQPPLSGRYVLVTNRSQTWMGPSQVITEKIQLFVTYQVSAWIRVGTGTGGPQIVNVALGVDNQYVNGGQAEVSDDKWYEIGGSFRIEKKPSRIILYLQGPAPGVDIMVAGLHVFPVNRQSRFRCLDEQIDTIRKRDVILKFSGLGLSEWLGAIVTVKQTENSFPIGSCISRTNLDNEDYVDFYAKNFNWAVFGNELKWYWTEPQQGNFNYRDADEMLDFCQKHGKQVRGHCIFWEVESNVQPWVRSLNQKDLTRAFQNRLIGLLTRYIGKFKHYDVNNEMLHGSFYQDRLGKGIRATMFRIARQLDPSAALFVNDYHVEDGCDAKSSPAKYSDQIIDLQRQGAPVGGIGIQGHIDSPVGPIVCSALNKLSVLGIPIWFTEVDASSLNEHVRADDLEVLLRECYAHPAVDGVMLWGFWELSMSRENSHLVDAEGEVNAAGRRLLELKKEWTSHAHGMVDEEGEFCFRGFQGTYEVEIMSACKKFRRTIVIEKGESPLKVYIDV